MEDLKSIIELISSLVFLAAAVIGASAFKYKNDSSIRDLYVENCKTIRAIMKNALSSGNISLQDILQVHEASNNAELFLHKEIVDFIKEICDKLIVIRMNDKKQDRANITNEELSRLIDKVCEAEIELGDLYQKSIDIYRKHIVQEPLFDNIKNLSNNQINPSWILNKITKKKSLTNS